MVFGSGGEKILHPTLFSPLFLDSFCFGSGLSLDGGLWRSGVI